jgi:ethylbenzene dioxygenase alpha subunit
MSSTLPISPSSLLDLDRGAVDRRIFWDRDLYELELERIFARCWSFVAHESQVPAPGDFVQAWMGQDQVLVVRQSDGSIGAFLNSCPHRGNRVCHAEAGRVRSFVCNYHGWAFGLDGRLRGIHETGSYDRDPAWDPSSVGLTPVAQLSQYKGLVFATFDPEAPSLDDYLGDFRWYLDAVLDTDSEGTEFVGGSIRSVMRCNWKLAAENFAGDALHAGWTHDSGANAMLGQGVVELGDGDSYQVNVNGHGWEFNLDGVGNAATFGDRRVLDYLRGRDAEVRARLGDLRARMGASISSANVFPNLSFLPGQNSWRVWVPKGPALTELHTWVLVNKGAPEEIKEAYRKGVMMTFSPSGVFEMDDGENWEYSTRTADGVVSRRQKLHYALGLDSQIDHPELPGNVFRSQINDANQRAFYRRWAELLEAETWADVPLDEVGP